MSAMCASAQLREHEQVAEQVLREDDAAGTDERDLRHRRALYAAGRDGGKRAPALDRAGRSGVRALPCRTARARAQAPRGPIRRRRARGSDSSRSAWSSAACCSSPSLALRVAGVGGDAGRYVPFAGFSRSVPMFERAERADGTPVWRTARARRVRTPQEFLADKPANGFRVFVVGESSAAGVPYTSAHAFSAFLAQRLQSALPFLAIEVVNAAVPGYGSRRMLPVVEDIALHQLDLLILYAGHNEFAEPRYYAHLVDMDPRLFRLWEWLAQTRLYRLAAQLPVVGVRERARAAALRLRDARQPTADVRRAHRPPRGRVPLGARARLGRAALPLQRRAHDRDHAARRCAHHAGDDRPEPRRLTRARRRCAPTRARRGAGGGVGRGGGARRRARRERLCNRRDGLLRRARDRRSARRSALPAARRLPRASRSLRRGAHALPARERPRPHAARRAVALQRGAARGGRPARYAVRRCGRRARAVEPARPGPATTCSSTWCTPTSPRTRSRGPIADARAPRVCRCPRGRWHPRPARADAGRPVRRGPRPEAEEPWCAPAPACWRSATRVRARPWTPSWRAILRTRSHSSCARAWHGAPHGPRRARPGSALVAAERRGTGPPPPPDAARRQPRNDSAEGVNLPLRARGAQEAGRGSDPPSPGRESSEDRRGEQPAATSPSAGPARCRGRRPRAPGSRRPDAAPRSESPRGHDPLARLRTTSRRPDPTQVPSGTPDAAASFDASWRYVYVNQKAAEVFVGRPADELLGRSGLEGVPRSGRNRSSSASSTAPWPSSARSPSRSPLAPCSDAGSSTGCSLHRTASPCGRAT